MNQNRLASSASTQSRFSLHAPPRPSSSDHEYHLYEPVDNDDHNLPFSRHLSLPEPKTNIFRQLIDTEYNYVRALKIILDHFRDPLKNREELQPIFKHVDYFHTIHSSFHYSLCVSKTDIATCFLKFKEKFTRYAFYCVTLFQAPPILDARNDELLEQCQREAAYKLRDLLFVPIQRILKYPLLLTQIIEKTHNRDDYLNLKRVHEIMVDLCHHLNEIKRDAEHIQIINEIEQSITGLSAQLTDYGRPLKDEKVKLKVGDSDAHLKVYVFVFEKAMLICKMNLAGFQLKELLNLTEWELCTKSSESSTREKWSHNFNLIRSSDGTKYHLYTRSAEHKCKWIKAILEAKFNMRPQSNHELIKSTFEVISYCDNCKKILHGMFFQGYRCRVCSMAVHKECITVHRPCRSSCEDMSETKIRMRLHDSSSTSQQVKLDSPLPNSPNYVNFKLKYYPWYCGRMGREQAQSILENTQDGTFLVRVSPKHNCSYVISLNYGSKVNHMRIFVSDDNRLYLSLNRHFESVPELVSWYESNSLVESFQMLDARLEIPIKSIRLTHETFESS